jgi:hypothetical protein
VKNIPEHYRNIGFGVVLAYLLFSEKGFTPTRQNKPESISKITDEQNGLDTILKSDFDWSSTDIPRLTALGQNLLLLKIVKDNFNIDNLSPSEIKAILYEKFRISKTNNAISMSLMENVGKYVDRIRTGSEYSYRITSQGKIKVEEILGKSRYE